MSLDGKVGLVTGAAGGIGLACARALAEAGARVVLSDIDEARGEPAAESLQADGLDVLFQRCDVRSSSGVEDLVARTVAAYGRLDIAVANAAVVDTRDFLQISEDDLDRVLAVNLKGVFFLNQAAARQMIAQGDGGAIVNMSSVNEVMAIPTIASYVIAKGGVAQLTKVAALALANQRIRVNAVGPGSIATEMFHKVNADAAARHTILSRTPLGRAGDPSEVASVVVFLASEASSYITGQTIYPDGGRLALNYIVPVEE